MNKNIILFNTSYGEENEAEYLEFLECNGYSEDECSREEYSEHMQDVNYEDIKYTLTENNKADKYVIFADLGRWNGRSSAVKMINNLQDIFEVCSCYDNIKISLDGSILKLEGSHHDATDFLIIKELKNNCSEALFEKLKYEVFFDSKQYNTLLKRYTKNVKILI